MGKYSLPPKPPDKHTEKAKKPAYDPSRRRALRNLAVLGLGITAASKEFLYFAEHEPEGPSHFLTEKEAIEIYKKLQTEIRGKWEEAKKKNTPLHIIALEDHNSWNAFGYELMLMDIAGRLGIHNLLLEVGHTPMEIVLSADFQNDPGHSYKQYMARKALDQRWPVGNIDKQYASLREENEAYRTLTQQRANEALARLYPSNMVSAEILLPDNPDSLVLPCKIVHPGNFTKEQLDACYNIVESERQAAYKIISDRRSEGMASAIKNHEDCLVVVGIKHGQKIISLLQQAERITAAFCVWDSIAKKDFSESLVSSDTSDVAWAHNSANAFLLERQFNPRKMPEFIERVCKEANSKGITPGGGGRL